MLQALFAPPCEVIERNCILPFQICQSEPDRTARVRERIPSLKGHFNTADLLFVEDVEYPPNLAHNPHSPGCGIYQSKYLEKIESHLAAWLIAGQEENLLTLLDLNISTSDTAHLVLEFPHRVFGCMFHKKSDSIYDFYIVTERVIYRAVINQNKPNQRKRLKSEQRFNFVDALASDSWSEGFVSFTAFRSTPCSWSLNGEIVLAFEDRSLGFPTFSGDFDMRFISTFSDQRFITKLFSLVSNFYASEPFLVNGIVNFQGVKSYVIGVCSDFKIRIWCREDGSCIYDQDIPTETQSFFHGDRKAKVRYAQPDYDNVKLLINYGDSVSQKLIIVDLRYDNDMYGKFEIHYSDEMLVEMNNCDSFGYDGTHVYVTVYDSDKNGQWDIFRKDTTDESPFIPVLRPCDITNKPAQTAINASDPHSFVFMDNSIDLTVVVTHNQISVLRNTTTYEKVFALSWIDEYDYIFRDTCMSSSENSTASSHYRVFLSNNGPTILGDEHIRTEDESILTGIIQRRFGGDIMSKMTQTGDANKVSAELFQDGEYGLQILLRSVVTSIQTGKKFHLKWLESWVQYDGILGHIQAKKAFVSFLLLMSTLYSDHGPAFIKKIAHEANKLNVLWALAVPEHDPINSWNQLNEKEDSRKDIPNVNASTSQLQHSTSTSQKYMTLLGTLEKDQRPLLQLILDSLVGEKDQIAPTWVKPLDGRNCTVETVESAEPLDILLVLYQKRLYDLALVILNKLDLPKDVLHCFSGFVNARLGRLDAFENFEKVEASRVVQYLSFGKNGPMKKTEPEVSVHQYANYVLQVFIDISNKPAERGERYSDKIFEFVKRICAGYTPSDFMIHMDYVYEFQKKAFRYFLSVEDFNSALHTLDEIFSQFSSRNIENLSPEIDAQEEFSEMLEIFVIRAITPSEKSSPAQHQLIELEALGSLHKKYSHHVTDSLLHLIAKLRIDQCDIYFNGLYSLFLGVKEYRLAASAILHMAERITYEAKNIEAQTIESLKNCYLTVLTLMQLGGYNSISSAYVYASADNPWITYNGALQLSGVKGAKFCRFPVYTEDDIQQRYNTFSSFSIMNKCELGDHTSEPTEIVRELVGLGEIGLASNVLIDEEDPHGAFFFYLTCLYADIYEAEDFLDDKPRLLSIITSYESSSLLESCAILIASYLKVLSTSDVSHRYHFVVKETLQELSQESHNDVPIYPPLKDELSKAN